MADQVVQAFQFCAALLGCHAAALGQQAQVAAGAEEVAAPGQHDGPHLRIGLGLVERGRQCHVQVGVEGIARGRIVIDEHAHRAALLAQDLAHAGTSRPSAM